MAHASRLPRIIDLKELTIDSTAVKANSAWPTDGKILTGLLGRAHRLGQQLETFGLNNFKKNQEEIESRWPKKVIILPPFSQLQSTRNC